MTAPRFTPPPQLRLVVPDAKRSRLQQRVASLPRVRRCSVPGCGAESLAVILVESEQEAVLCPIHQLVQLDGRPIGGQPLLATGV